MKISRTFFLIAAMWAISSKFWLDLRLDSPDQSGADSFVMIKVYEYAGCSTCKKALKFLEDKKVRFEKLPIVEMPPTPAELKKMLSYLKRDGGDFRKLFNTSGVLYREMGLGQKIKDGLSEGEALALLAKHGKLIKRPFLLTKNDGAVGFNPATWSRLL